MVPTTARGVMVAPENWSNTPPSRRTFQPAGPGSVSERPAKPSIQSSLPISILSPRPGVSVCERTRAPRIVPSAATAIRTRIAPPYP